MYCVCIVYYIAVVYCVGFDRICRRGCEPRRRMASLFFFCDNFYDSNNNFVVNFI
jgi:hypothetical protein